MVANIISIALQHDLHPHLLLYWALPLVKDGDLDWLIERVRNAPVIKEQKFISKLISLVFNREDASQIDKILLATKEIAALAEECAPCFEIIELSSPRADQLKREYEQHLELGISRRPKSATHPPMPEIVKSWLAQFEAGDTDAWWRLNLDLTLKPNSDHYPSGAEFNSDLTSLPGWQELDDHLRVKCVQTAHRYLLERGPNTADWLGTNIFHRPAAAGYRALLLLQKLAPAFLEELPTETWQQWAPAIIGYPETPGVDASEAMESIVATAYRHAPNEIQDTMIKLIDYENEEHGHIFVLPKVERCWDDLLASVLLEKLCHDESLKPDSVATLIESLLIRDFVDTKEQILGYLTKPLPNEYEKLEISRKSASLLLIYFGEEGW